MVQDVLSDELVTRLLPYPMFICIQLVTGSIVVSALYRAAGGVSRRTGRTGWPPQARGPACRDQRC